MEWVALLGFAGACAAAASTGAMYPPGKWYDMLEKPNWTPPNWLFPLAWTFLYAAMAYAAWRVAYAPVELAAPALAFWACQIACNAIWTPIFFGKKWLGSAMVAIGCLWAAVLGTMLLFFQADTLSGLLIVPYLIWVSYAGALNWWIWQKNPDAWMVDLD